MLCFTLCVYLPAAAEKEESVKEFIKRNLGDEVFERLIEPFCSGVYAGDPSKLSMEAAFQRVSRGCFRGCLRSLQTRFCAEHPEPVARSSF
jgi:hypothetical protein